MAAGEVSYFVEESEANVEEIAKDEENKATTMPEQEIEAPGKLDDKEKKLFIEAFQSYPCLWNTSLADYKNKLKKVEASKALSSRFKLSMEDMKKIMHSLRTSMVREVKRMQGNKNYVSKWKFFKTMEFLKEEVINGLQCKEDKEWADDEIETVVEFYKENQFLWNHHLSEYRDRDKKEIAMRKIQDQLPNRSCEDIKSQWHKLKTIFDREDKRVEGSKRSGTGTDSVYVPTWKFYKLLMFTKSCAGLDESRSSLSITTNEEGVSTNKKIKKERSGKNQEEESLKMELWKEALKALTAKENENDPNEVRNEVHTFCMMVENTLTRFDNRRRAIAKKKINDVLFTAEMEQEDSRMDIMGGSRYMYQQQPQYMMPPLTPQVHERPTMQSSTPYHCSSLPQHYQRSCSSPSTYSQSSVSSDESGMQYCSSYLQDLG